MEIEFHDLKELYNRLEPALEVKVTELKRVGYKGFEKKDIWYYLSNTVWMDANDLSLHQMVDDILKASNEEINQYKLNNSRG